MKSFIFSLALFASMLVGISNASAYFTTEQNVYRINDQTALFQIEYLFGSEDNDIYLPVRAARGQAWGTENKQIGFEILKDGKPTDEGDAGGVVMGPITFSTPGSSNEQYVAPAGLALRMSLFVVLEVEPSATTSRYQVQVTDLPFYTGKDQEYQRLNPSELKYYKTPSLNLNRNLEN